MDISAPNLSNAPTSSPPPLNESSPQTSYNAEAVDDSRFVMPSISPFPQNNNIKTDTALTMNSNNPTPSSTLQQPTIPLPFLNPTCPNNHPHSNSNISHQHNQIHNQIHNRNNNRINTQNNQNQQQHQHNHSQQPHPHQHQQQCNRNHNHNHIHNHNHNHPHGHPHPHGHQHGQHQSLHHNPLRNMCMTNNNNNNMRSNIHRPPLHNNGSNNQSRLQAQQQQAATQAAAAAAQQQRANGHNSISASNANDTGGNNNINNVNHIQNKYNTTIINLNGVTPATFPKFNIMNQQQQSMDNNDNDIHSYEETINIPYPSTNNGHMNKNNINIIRAKARTNAQHPMAPNLTKRGSIMGNKYKILSIITDGTFSRTVCAQDIKTLKLVAVKIMKDKCQYVGVQEAKRLSFFNNKDSNDVCHIVRFIETIHYQGRFCLVLEILGKSLFKYLQINQTCNLDLVRKIAIQLMISIQFIHSFNKIHADLKPENILLCKPQNQFNNDAKSIKNDKNNDMMLKEEYKDSCKVKVIDFGNSISLQQREAYLEKFEVQSLYYRAPEVLLGCRFGLSIDLWSIGCILMELVLGKPLFATNNKSRLCQQIHNILGPFPIHAYQNAKFYKEYFNKPSFITHQSIYAQLFSQRYEGIDKILKNKFNAMNEWSDDHDHFVQFIASLLDLDPSTRMKASDSFYHPFLQKCFPFKKIFSNSITNSTMPSISNIRIKKDTDSMNNNSVNNSINMGSNNKKLSLSNIDLSDNNALQKHKSQICHNQHQFGAECTKLPPNFRNPLIQQLHQTNSNNIHNHQQHNHQQQQLQHQRQQQQQQHNHQHMSINNNRTQQHQHHNNNQHHNHQHHTQTPSVINNSNNSNASQPSVSVSAGPGSVISHQHSQHNGHNGHINMNGGHNGHNHNGHMCQTHGHNHNHNHNHHQHHNHMNNNMNMNMQMNMNIRNNNNQNINQNNQNQNQNQVQNQLQQNNRHQHQQQQQQSHQHIHQHINNINNMNVINGVNNVNNPQNNNVHNQQFLGMNNNNNNKNVPQLRKPIFLNNHSNHSNQIMTQQQQQQRNTMRGNPFTNQNDTKIGLIDNNNNNNNGIQTRKRNRVINDSQSVSTDFSQPLSQKMKH